MTNREVIELFVDSNYNTILVADQNGRIGSDHLYVTRIDSTMAGPVLALFSMDEAIAAKSTLNSDRIVSLRRSLSLVQHRHQNLLVAVYSEQGRRVDFTSFSLSIYWSNQLDRDEGQRQRDLAQRVAVGNGGGA